MVAPPPRCSPRRSVEFSCLSCSIRRYLTSIWNLRWSRKIDTVKAERLIVVDTVPVLDLAGWHFLTSRTVLLLTSYAKTHLDCLDCRLPFSRAHEVGWCCCRSHSATSSARMNSAATKTISRRSYFAMFFLQQPRTVVIFQKTRKALAEGMATGAGLVESNPSDPATPNTAARTNIYRTMVCPY